MSDFIQGDFPNSLFFLTTKRLEKKYVVEQGRARRHVSSRLDANNGTPSLVLCNSQPCYEN